MVDDYSDKYDIRMSMIGGIVMGDDKNVCMSTTDGSGC